MKRFFRHNYLNRRENLSEKRRKEASVSLLEYGKSLEKGALVASFSSFRGEIDTSLLNDWLAKEGRLALPKMDGKQLQFFLVTDCRKQLTSNFFGLFEPIEAAAQEINLTPSAYLLIPGLTFDQEGYRLGYGKGFYDRFLSQHPFFFQRIGIGFKEQLHEGSLPVSLNDVPVQALQLF